MVLPHKQAQALRELQSAMKTHREAGLAKYRAVSALEEANERLKKAKLEFERAIALALYEEKGNDDILILA